MKFKLINEEIYQGDKVKFFTNGEKTIKLKPGDEIPDGFHLGRTFNHVSWNKGLTAETDPRVKANGQKTRETRLANGGYSSWNKGLTKETNDSLKVVSQKVSAARKGQPAWNRGVPASEEQKQKQSAAMMGKPAWNKGLTKETNSIMKQISDKLKGHECYVTDWDAAKRKEYETKKLNGTFNSSRLEKKLIQEFIDQYGEENVIHPYRDDRYPFNCDIYIKPLDLFVEVQGTIEHNGRPFDKNNPQHQEEAQKILQVAESKGPSSRYWNVYKWWTQIDPLKLETLRKNNLNFRLIYPDGLIIDK